MDQKKNSSSASSVQQYLDIAEIKDGVVILKDGSLRVVLATSSVNFDLKSDKEQEAIIFAYQQFLNSLDFPVQIVVSSRRFDVVPYLHSLDQKRKTEQNELLKNQINDYMNFVKELVKIANVMSKSFYIVVPFYLIESKRTGFFEKFSNAVNPSKAIYQKIEEFESYKNQLLQRVEQVREAISGTGVRAVPLNTQELIELFYNHYNPSEFEHINIADVEDIDIQG